MSISQNFPNTRPSLVLDFANSKKLDSRITFTRGSTGTYMDDNGLIRTAGINQPRFDHDPTTGESLGLLIEEARTNLLPESEDLTSGLISKIAITTSNDTGVIAPDGTAGATRVIQDNTTAQHLIGDTTAGLTLGGNYALSCFVKAGTTDLVWFSVNTYTNWVDDWNFFINLTTGNVYGNSGDISNANLKVEEYTNGWWKLSMVAQQEPAGGGSGGLWLSHANPNGTLSTNFAGDGSTYFYAWGFQMEEGSFPTSYIPTSGSTVTRSADFALMTETNFSSWYNQTEGTYITSSRYDGTPRPGVDNRVVFNAISSLGAIYWSAFWDGNNKATWIVEDPPGTYHAVLSSGDTLSIGQTRKNASVYKTNDFAFTANGNVPSTDTSGAITSTAISLCIGTVNLYYWHLNGRIGKIAYYPVRLPNDQLQTLTK